VATQGTTALCIYGMLFQAAAESLLTIAADPRRLGAQIGFLAVLHTWGQNLHVHPHVHCVVPGGGLSSDRSQWIACRPGFFLPVRVLGRLFRAKFLSFLRDAYDRQQISFHGQQRHLEDLAFFRQLVTALREKEWVVYAKPPFGGSPEIVLKYPARYTHRVAISNYRLIAIGSGRGSVQWVLFEVQDLARIRVPDVYRTSDKTLFITVGIEPFGHRIVAMPCKAWCFR